MLSMVFTRRSLRWLLPPLSRPIAPGFIRKKHSSVETQTERSPESVPMHCSAALSRRIKGVAASPLDNICDSISLYVSISGQNLVRGSYDYRSRQAPATIWSLYEGI